MNSVYIIVGRWNCGDSEILAVYSVGKGDEAHAFAEQQLDSRKYDSVHVEVHKVIS